MVETESQAWYRVTDSLITGLDGKLKGWKPTTATAETEFDGEMNPENLGN